MTKNKRCPYFGIRWTRHFMLSSLSALTIWGVALAGLATFG